MSIQSAIDTVTPIAKVEFISVAMLPYAFIVLLTFGCAIALIGVFAGGREKSKGGTRD